MSYCNGQSEAIYRNVCSNLGFIEGYVEILKKLSIVGSALLYCLLTSCSSMRVESARAFEDLADREAKTVEAGKEERTV